MEVTPTHEDCRRLRTWQVHCQSIVAAEFLKSAGREGYGWSACCGVQRGVSGRVGWAEPTGGFDHALKPGNAFGQSRLPLAQRGDSCGQASVEPINALAELQLLEKNECGNADDDGDELCSTVKGILRLRLADERTTLSQTVTGGRTG